MIHHLSIWTIRSNKKNISKLGNRYFRKTVYKIMKSIKAICTENSELKTYILKKETEGKAKK